MHEPICIRKHAVPSGDLLILEQFVGSFSCQPHSGQAHPSGWQNYTFLGLVCCLSILTFGFFSYPAPNPTCFLVFCFLRQSFSVWYWLSWNRLYRLASKSVCLLLPPWIPASTSLNARIKGGSTPPPTPSLVLLNNGCCLVPANGFGHCCVKLQSQLRTGSHLAGSKGVMIMEPL